MTIANSNTCNMLSINVIFTRMIKITLYIKHTLTFAVVTAEVDKITFYTKIS